MLVHVKRNRNKTLNSFRIVSELFQGNYARVSEGICFHRRWFVCVSVCLFVTTITKKIVDGFAPNFMRRFLGGNERPSSCFVTIGREMWK